MGRFGHYTLIPARDAVEGVGHVWVPYTRDQIRTAPRIEPNAPLTAGTERELLAHYGIAVDAGRAAELDGARRRRRQRPAGLNALRATRRGGCARR